MGLFRTSSLVKLLKVIIPPSVRINAAEIKKRVSRITDRPWNPKLKSSAITKDVQIRAIMSAEFNDNLADLIPPEEFMATFDCEQQLS